jgi:hypothetical protein
LQNGQEKTVSSLSILFFGGGLAADFLFPIVNLSFFFLQIKPTTVISLDQKMTAVSIGTCHKIIKFDKQYEQRKPIFYRSYTG